MASDSATIRRLSNRKLVRQAVLEGGIGQNQGMSTAAVTLALTVERRGDVLRSSRRSIHTEHGLASADHRSAGRIADLAAAEVFEVKLGVAGLNNAFIRHRRARPVAEVGGACRHNVIALACSGAALALREVVESLIRRSSRSQDLPKRSGGTKVQLLRRGHSATW